MKCPHCGGEVDIADVVYRNVESYRKTVVARTECCGKGLYVRPVFSVEVSPYNGDNKEDSWGAPIS